MFIVLLSLFNTSKLYFKLAKQLTQNVYDKKVVETTMSSILKHAYGIHMMWLAMTPLVRGWLE